MIAHEYNFMNGFMTVFIEYKSLYRYKMLLHRKSLLKFTYSEYLLCHVHLKSKALTLGIRDVFLFTSFFENGILIRKFNLTFICAHICIILIKIQKGKMYTPYFIPLCYMVSSFPYKFI